MTIASTGNAAKPGPDRVWRNFIDWLPSAPVMETPQPLFDAYRARLIAVGTPAATADEQMAIILRAMRTSTDGWRVMFNSIYGASAPGFSTQPSGLLVSTVEGRSPGRVLDVGMGQGRNAVFLAMRGWDVTGFDISDGGLRIANRNAARAGVKLKTEVNSIQAFALGHARWDLIVLTYEPAPLTTPAYVADLAKALRPGGLVVVESFASDADAVRRRPVDIDPQSLRRAFATFRILHFEDVVAMPEWTKEKTRLVRLVAEKSSPKKP